MYEQQCKKAKDTLITTLDKAPLAAVFMLGNLYLTLEKAKSSDTKKLDETILFLEDKLSSKNIQSLWHTVTHVSKTERRLMETANVESLDKVTEHLIRDPKCFKSIKAESLISFGQTHVEWYREILIALIRKHLDSTKHKDPFADEKFSYDTLKQGDAEQNFHYSLKFMKKCHSLPIDQIVELGSEKSEIAKLILKDIKDCKGYFEISTQYVELHADIRKSIAKEWKGHLETFPLKESEKKVVAEELPKLQKKHPEFKEVKQDARVERNHHAEPEANGNVAIGIFAAGLSFLMIMKNAAPAKAGAAIAAKCACTKAAAAATTAAAAGSGASMAPLILPLAALAGVTYFLVRAFRSQPSAPATSTPRP